ncbi:MAG: OmpA family protein [Bacteroidales bacterium]|nr:OmpA family protein [Bacteroidales bacterium]
MRLFRFYACILVLFLGLSTSLVAQRNFTEEADDAYELKQYYDAIELYQKAYSKIKGNRAERARILFRIAECYRITNNTKRAESQYRRVTRSGYPDPIAHYYLGEALKSNEKYDEAIIAFTEFKTKAPNDPRGDQGIESCRLAQMWKDNPTRYEVENVRQLNSRENDFSAAYADRKYLSLMFTSSRDGVLGKGTDAWTGENFTCLFFTEQSRSRRGRRGAQPEDPMGSWSAPVLLDEGPINTPANEGAPTLNERGSTMYFTKCMIERRQTITCKIYVAQKRGRAWGEPELVPLGPDSFNFGHPSLSADELVLYFASDMPGGQGGRDIWMASRDRKTRPFETPVNLGSTINTSSDELYPFIRDDNALFFSSNGHIGMGGLDIFKAEKTGETWGTPQNMKFPINTPGDDFAIIFEGTQEKGFFSSNRNGGRGGDDIYSFFLPPLIFTLQGVVKDDETKLIISNANVKLVGTDGTILEVKTDERGSYKFDKTQILPNTTYELLVTKDGYFSSTATETTVGVEQSRDFVVNFDLVPIPRKPITLPEILYALDDYRLQAQFQDSLNGLITTMTENPKLVIELGSHTDSRASHAYNDTLSQKRAESVVDYLIEKGIAADRMQAKGYGERVPRTLDVEIIREGHTFPAGTVLNEEYINSLPSTKVKEAAHQLNRRTEFRILHENYVPSNTNVPIERTRIEIINNEPADTIPAVDTTNQQNPTIPNSNPNRPVNPNPNPNTPTNPNPNTPPNSTPNTPPPTTPRNTRQ